MVGISMYKGFALGPYNGRVFEQFQFLESRVHWLCTRKTSRWGWIPGPESTIDQQPEGRAVGANGSRPQVKRTSVAWQLFLEGVTDGVSTACQYRAGLSCTDSPLLTPEAQEV